MRHLTKKGEGGMCVFVRGEGGGGVGGGGDHLLPAKNINGRWESHF